MDVVTLLLEANFSQETGSVDQARGGLVASQKTKFQIQ